MVSNLEEVADNYLSDLEKVDSYEVRESDELFLRSGQFSYWMVFRELEEGEDLSEQLETDKLAEISQDNRYLEIGASYEEDGQIYRKLEIRPADFSKGHQEVESALKTVDG